MSFFNLTELGAGDPVKSSVSQKQHPSTRNATGAGTTTSHISPSSDSICPNSQAKGSYVKYTTMLQKHQRSPEGSNDIYNKPVTTNMKYGWWMRDGVQSEPWTKTERHSCVHSEMTRFVDEMSLTNREFTLF